MFKSMTNITTNSHTSEIINAKHVKSSNLQDPNIAQLARCAFPSSIITAFGKNSLNQDQAMRGIEEL